MMNSPNVYLIAGPNGAGKTTFATRFLPSYVKCREFLNADLIASGLSPFAPETQDFRAGRLLLTRIHELIKSRSDFGFETTLAGRNYYRLLEDMKQNGYRVSLFFLWLPDPDMAVSRVAFRVSEGGHYLPEDVIRRRYDLGLQNLFDLYRPLVDTFEVYNASDFPPLLAARENIGDLEIFDQSSYQLFTESQKR